MSETTAAMIHQELEKYEIGEIELNALRDDVNPLLELNLTEVHNYNQLAKGLQRVIKTRTGIAAKHKELKAPALKLGKALDAEKNRLTDLVLAIERPLASKKTSFDIEIQQEQQRVVTILNQLKSIPIQILDENLSDLNIQLRKLEAFDLNEANLGNREDDAVTLIAVAHNAITAAIVEAKRKAQEKLEQEQKDEEQAATAKRQQEKQDDLDRREKKLAEKEQAVLTAPEEDSTPTIADNTLTGDKPIASAMVFVAWLSVYLQSDADGLKDYLRYGSDFEAKTELLTPAEWRDNPVKEQPDTTKW